MNWVNHQLPVALDIAIKRKTQFNAPNIPAAITMSHRWLDACLYSKVDITPDAISGSGGVGKSRLPKANADMKGGANGIDITTTVRSTLKRDGRFELKPFDRMPDAS